MSIWFEPDLTAAQLQPLGKNTMGDHLGIEFTEVGEDFLKGRMPVDNRTRQPYGLLHGGASVALAETLGSVAAAFVVDRRSYNTVGLEINANHLRGVREGFVTGIARPLHLGKTTHVWEIRIHDERDKLVCISRLTVAIIPVTAGTGLPPQEHR
jgi:1,4-dihydroxy-2-naphthoyl-CoA hydrolase